jgi:hypothetical protein
MIKLQIGYVSEDWLQEGCVDWLAFFHGNNVPLSLGHFAKALFAGMRL